MARPSQKSPAERAQFSQQDTFRYTTPTVSKGGSIGSRVHMPGPDAYLLKNYHLPKQNAAMMAKFNANRDLSNPAQDTLEALGAINKGATQLQQAAVQYEQEQKQREAEALQEGKEAWLRGEDVDLGTKTKAFAEGYEVSEGKAAAADFDAQVSEMLINMGPNEAPEEVMAKAKALQAQMMEGRSNYWNQGFYRSSEESLRGFSLGVAGKVREEVKQTVLENMHKAANLDIGRMAQSGTATPKQLRAYLDNMHTNGKFTDLRKTEISEIVLDTVAAIAAEKEDPTLLEGFLQAPSKHGGISLDKTILREKGEKALAEIERHVQTKRKARVAAYNKSVNSAAVDAGLVLGRIALSGMQQGLSVDDIVTQVHRAKQTMFQTDPSGKFIRYNGWLIKTSTLDSIIDNSAQAIVDGMLNSGSGDPIANGKLTALASEGQLDIANLDHVGLIANASAETTAQALETNAAIQRNIKKNPKYSGYYDAMVQAKQSASKGSTNAFQFETVFNNALQEFRRDPDKFIENGGPEKLNQQLQNTRKMQLESGDIKQSLSGEDTFKLLFSTPVSTNLAAPGEQMSEQKQQQQQQFTSEDKVIMEGFAQLKGEQ